jgi:hypothetical protein
MPILVEDGQTALWHDAAKFLNEQRGIVNEGDHPAAPGEIVIGHRQIVPFSSPSSPANRVRPAGPPMASSSKLAAVLSLCSIAAAQMPHHLIVVSKKFCGGSLFDNASKLLETHEHKGDFKEP